MSLPLLRLLTVCANALTVHSPTCASAPLWARRMAVLRQAGILRSLDGDTAAANRARGLHVRACDREVSADDMRWLRMACIDAVTGFEALNTSARARDIAGDNDDDRDFNDFSS